MSYIQLVPKSGRSQFLQGSGGDDSSLEAGGLLPKFQAWDVSLDFVNAF